ncbi:MAG: CatA-like O-acetyltransferase [archaeon]|uniref:Chloramphenicol O-acetyltransferase type A n=1 Tax=Methanobrevibacter gottschalkii DSM 11977 TaxID=1122229 RepID=A0A3N5B0U0_9EURY|nr:MULTISPECIES: CatA-like O-acetyltransferase [Methanobrevibacter]MCQ2970582.1 CatA-like O-acetyltransferase [archaeon]OEC96955.1 chloramphenicol acetyltransferase [Methanobrevibacter sp. A27]RPF50954.1 chloramphenicol O-acetyltransferase type A [Methanobrevibacter gottschalkii DSM 11977]
MKEIKFNLDENPFINFLSARYSMSAKINVEKLWKWCHENNKSFFIMSLGCLMNAVNSVPELKRRIINGKAIEHDYLDGVSPIMDEGNKIYREMRVKTPQEFNDILKWHDYIKDYSKNILSGKEEGFTIEMEKRDLENIANFSCIPWVDFDMITNCVLSGNQIQPLITWGKVNEKYEMSISITVSHIFVNGRELGYFYENAQKEFDKF